MHFQVDVSGWPSVVHEVHLAKDLFFDLRWSSFVIFLNMRGPRLVS